MRLKLDENLGRSAAGLLRHAGHDVATIAEQELWGTADRALIEICLAERRCLVTLDMDFGNPLLLNPSDYAGIAVLRLPPRPSHENLLETIQTLIGGIARETIEGRLWIVQRGRIRTYQPEE